AGRQPGRQGELGALQLASGRHVRTAPVEGPRVRDLPRGVGELHDRVVGRVLEVVAVSGTLVEAGQLRARQGVDAVAVVDDVGDRWPPTVLRPALGRVHPQLI